MTITGDGASGAGDGLLDRLLGVIEEVSGIVVPTRDRSRVEAVALARMRASRCRDLEAYARLLQSGSAGDEWRALLERLTVKESYLFRASRQFAVLEDVVLPDLVSRRPPEAELRVWSAGCARGEEAATLAVVLAESRAMAGRGWRILATDVDERALDEGRSGFYGARAVSAVPPELLARHFERVGDRWRLEQALLERIDFRPVNLVREPLDLPSAPWDVIFMRNVLIYFSEGSQGRVVRAVATAMAPDGWLFLGPSESLLRLETGLRAVDLQGCFAYRVEPSAGDGATSGGLRPSATRPRPSVHGPRPFRHARPAATAVPPPASREEVVEALADGRFETARALAEDAAARAADDAVLRALHGLCRDRGGDAEGAIREYRAALYLDPGLFQIRLLLAACLERRGWPERARQERREVLSLLRSSAAHEVPDAERLGLATVEGAMQEARAGLGD